MLSHEPCYPLRGLGPGPGGALHGGVLRSHPVRWPVLQLRGGTPDTPSSPVVKLLLGAVGVTPEFRARALYWRCTGSSPLAGSVPQCLDPEPGSHLSKVLGAGRGKVRHLAAPPLTAWAPAGVVPLSNSATARSQAATHKSQQARRAAATPGSQSQQSGLFSRRRPGLRRGGGQAAAFGRPSGPRR